MDENLKFSSKLRQGKDKKRDLKRIEWNTVKKIIISLDENGRMKKSHIATMCNMGYDKCLLYLNWLELMDLIRRDINEEGLNEIILTEKGKLLHSKKFDNKKISEEMKSY
jgi:predicted transcriptional regulator